MLKSRRKALRNLLQEKVVNIGDYRDLRQGRAARKIGIFSADAKLIEAVKADLAQSADIQGFDGRFSLESALKSAEWDGFVLDDRDLKADTLALCEKIKKAPRAEEMFVVILSDQKNKDIIRQGFEKGCDEWVANTTDAGTLARLLLHHLSLSGG